MYDIQNEIFKYDHQQWMRSAQRIYDENICREQPHRVRIDRTFAISQEIMIILPIIFVASLLLEMAIPVANDNRLLFTFSIDRS